MTVCMPTTVHVGEGGHNRMVKVKRAVARELCRSTPGL